MPKPRPSWYVDKKFVREKTRHTWTETERKQVYTLRKDGQPVDLIIQALKLHGQVTRTQVYNIIRGRKNFLECKCSCGAKLKKRELLAQMGKVSPKCEICLAKNSALKKSIRRRNLRKGLCGVCGDKPVVKGHKTCKLCLSADYRRSYLQGNCGRCHTRPISKNSTALCDVCLETNRKNTHAYRKQLEHADCA